MGGGMKGGLSITLFPLVVLSALMFGPSEGYGEGKTLDTFEKTRVAWKKQTWRNAHTIPAGETVITLGEAPGGSHLRLGILPPEDKTKPVEFEVWRNESRILRTTAERVWPWQDRRVRVKGEDGQAGIWKVRFRCEKAFYVAPCELVSPNTRRPNVLFLVIDTLRLDHVGCYGYERDTTPHLDAFAKDAVRFTHFTPQSSWTKPSVASFLTGVYPEVHGARDTGDVMRSELPSLAQNLATAGYTTHGVVANDYLLPHWGFGEDFENYEWIHSSQRDSALISRAMRLAGYDAGRPWYLYAHAMGPHSPYWPKKASYFQKFQPQEKKRSPEEIREALGTCAHTNLVHQARKVLGVPKPAAGTPQPPISGFFSEAELKALCVDLYDGEIASTDAQFGRLVAYLKESGQYDNTLIVVTSDHGEEFWEHGDVYHGQTLYEEQLRVPCLMKLPGSEHAGEVYEAAVNGLDLAPTLLDLLDLPPEPGFQGHSFASIEEPADTERQLAYASLLSVRWDRDQRVVKNTQFKYYETRKGARGVWFDLDADPIEKAPLPAAPAIADPFLAQLRTVDLLSPAGLQILLTGALKGEPLFEGSLVCSPMGRAELVYPEENCELTRKENRLEFSVKMKALPDRVIFQQSFQALLRVEMPPEGRFTVDLRVNGEPIPPECVFAGGKRKHHTLQEEDFTAAKLEAPAGFVKRALLPEQMAVHIWYVPPPEQIAEEALDPETRENLRALGYLE